MSGASASFFSPFFGGSSFFGFGKPNLPPLGGRAAYSLAPSLRWMVQSLSGPKRSPRLRSGAGLPSAFGGVWLDAELSNRPSNTAEQIAVFRMEVLAKKAHHRRIRGMRFGKRRLFYNLTEPSQRPTAIASLTGLLATMPVFI